MKALSILLLFVGLSFCSWNPLVNMHLSPDFHTNDHHKGKMPCQIPEKFVTHVSKTYLDKDGCPTSYHLGIFLYDFPNQRVRFDEVSYYNASKNSTHWVDFNAGKSYSYNHISKKCVSRDLSGGKSLPKMDLKGGKFRETLLVGAEAIDLWIVEKTCSSGKYNAIVGVTQGTCFLTNMFAFKMANNEKGLIPIAAASMWNFAPTIPLYQFHLPEACQNAALTEEASPIEDFINF